MSKILSQQEGLILLERTGLSLLPLKLYFKEKKED